MSRDTAKSWTNAGPSGVVLLASAFGATVFALERAGNGTDVLVSDYTAKKWEKTKLPAQVAWEPQADAYFTTMYQNNWLLLSSDFNSAGKNKALYRYDDQASRWSRVARQAGSRQSDLNRFPNVRQRHGL